MNNEQERVAYQEWADLHPIAYAGIEYDAFIAGYQAGRAALQSQEREDAERLDWLDSLNTKLNQHYGTTCCWNLVLSTNVVRLMSGRGGNGYVADIDLHDGAPHSQGAPSIREAIDARRRIEGEGE